MDLIKNWEAIQDEILRLVTSYGFDFVGAIIILIVGWMLAGWARRGTLNLADRAEWIDPTLKPLLGSLVRYAVLIFTLIAVLGQFGIETTSIIAVLGAAGLAVGLALQGTLSNVASGVMILVLRPFKVGDYVETGGVGGTVKEVGLFRVELATLDNLYLSVPNSQAFNSVITNYSRHDTRRIDLIIGIGYSSDIEKAMDVLVKLAEADERVLGDPEPQVTVRALGESSVDVGLRFWVDASNYWGTITDTRKSVKLALDNAGIEIPFPHRVVEVKNGSLPG
ncbi:MAG: mechanosensitive ion channel [Rhodospirillaceae bacterium]|nr:mechanosensitive ion channel [Rhodospirillaceae bacterium]MBT6137544.1 mechanosensitive ion channel [Rhodospirillaceae bacterium]